VSQREKSRREAARKSEIRSEREKVQNCERAKKKARELETEQQKEGQKKTAHMSASQCKRAGKTEYRFTRRVLTLRHTTTLSTTLLHYNAATYSNALQRTVPHCNTL